MKHLEIVGTKSECTSTALGQRSAGFLRRNSSQCAKEYGKGGARLRTASGLRAVVCCFFALCLMFGSVPLVYAADGSEITRLGTTLNADSDSVQATSAFTTDMGDVIDCEIYTTHYGDVKVPEGSYTENLDIQVVKIRLDFASELTLLDKDALGEELALSVHYRSAEYCASTEEAEALVYTDPGTYRYVIDGLSSDGKSLYISFYLGYAPYSGRLIIESPEGGTTALVLADTAKTTGENTGGTGVTINFEAFIPNGLTSEITSYTVATEDELASAVIKFSTDNENGYLVTRGMVHLLVLVNGQPYTLNSYKSSITTHWHAYLTLETSTYVGNIAGWGSSLTSAFSFESNGDELTLTYLNSEPGDVVELYISSYLSNGTLTLDTSALETALEEASALLAVDAPEGLEEEYAALQSAVVFGATSLNSGYFSQSVVDAKTAAITKAIAELNGEEEEEDPDDGSGGSDDDTDPSPDPNPDLSPDPSPVVASIERLGGSNRYATMALVSQAAFSTSGSCSTVIICRGNNFPDALAAAGLAGVTGGQVLLTSTSQLSSSTASEISRLGATKAYVIGDENSVSLRAYNEIRALVGGNVERISGSNRYKTALAIYKEGATCDDGWSNIAFIATGTKAADSLSASTVAYGLKAPIFLADASGSLSSEVLSALASGGFAEVVILGDTYSVSSATVKQVASLTGATMTRLGGANRYETSQLLANWAYSKGFTTETIIVSAGRNGKYADALVASSLGGKLGAAMLLVNDGTSGETCIDTLVATAASEGVVANVYVLGDENSVSNALYSKIEALFE